MIVEIWSDVVCPWCAIGKARFERALADLPWADEVEVRWRSYELAPDAPAIVPGDYVTRLARKYRVSESEARAMIDRVVSNAEAEGLHFDFSIAQPGNTFDAHRLLHLAADLDASPLRTGYVQHKVKDRFLRGYHSEGEAIGDHDTLTRLAVEAGLPEDEVTDTLRGDRYADAVRADEQEAFDLGCSGVPFFVVDRRFAVPGAQDPTVFREVLDKARAAAQPLAVVGSDGAGACDDGTCAV